MHRDRPDLQDRDRALAAEWLLADGAGGYASSTVLFCPTRRYHGLWVPALRPPLARHVILSHVDERLVTDEGEAWLSTTEYAGGFYPDGSPAAQAFHAAPLPRLVSHACGATVERHVVLLDAGRTACVTYEVQAPGAWTLDLAPMLAMRPMHHLGRKHDRFRVEPLGGCFETPGPLTPPLSHGGEREVLEQPLGDVPGPARAKPGYAVAKPGWRVLVEGLPAVFVWVATGDSPGRADGGQAEASVAPAWYEGVVVRVERDRGFDFVEDLLAPGRWQVRGSGAGGCRLFGSFDPPRAMDVPAACRSELARRADLRRLAGSPKDARLARLAEAADAFLVRRPPASPSPLTGEGRGEGAVSPGPGGAPLLGCHAGGDSRRRGLFLERAKRHGCCAAVAPRDLLTVIAGYPWFADWGRDAMIALPGLAIETGRLDEAGRVLRCFAGAASEGMIPNCFDEATGRPEYNTVDASLWFLQALADYAEAGGDEALVEDRLWPVALEIVERYRRGTRFGIRADSDGLILAGDADTQLTWMDARVGGRPVTPRFGKPVEVQALWISGLARMEDLAETLGREPPEACGLGEGARAAFDAAFWNDRAGCLFDCLYPDGRADASVRPNQIFAVGLPYAPLSGDRAKRVVAVVRYRLLTPRGVRTLARDDPSYRGRYEGGPAERDAAYHQGTVWPWLLGPYGDAVFRVERAECARGECTQLLEGLLDAMDEAGLGQIGEIFDGDPPHRPGGCIAQAWSVAAAIHLWRLVGRR